MKNLIIRISLITSILILSSCKSSYNRNNIPFDFVPDSATAIKIAEAIWLPLYGESIYDKKPYKVELIDNGKVWRVKGTLKLEEIGGVPIIEIQKGNCKVIKVIHTK